MLDRRQILRYVLRGAIALPLVSYGQAQADPWPESALLNPADLNKLIEDQASLEILCVGFSPLYHARHLPHAQLAGPASQPDGMRMLEQAAVALKPGSQIILYCGCCPMVRCPNIRPAYETLQRRKIQNVRVLNLPHNLHTDWVEKGYPTESSET